MGLYRRGVRTEHQLKRKLVSIQDNAKCSGRQKANLHGDELDLAAESGNLRDTSTSHDPERNQWIASMLCSPRNIAARKAENAPHVRSFGILATQLGHRDVGEACDCWLK